MIDNLSKFIFRVSLIIFFIFAIILFLKINENNKNLISLAQNEYINHRNLKVKNYENSKKKFYGYEIIVSIISGLEYDIKVGNKFFYKNKNYKSVDLSFISENEVYTSYININQNGEIDYIKYIDE